MATPKIAVILAGCGFKDGSEIREAVLALTGISEAGATFECFAPDKELDEIDHLTMKPTGKKRSILHEAARIARGDVKSLREASAKNFDGLVMPGGFGAAKNLCTFAFEGASCKVDPDVERFVDEFIAEKKPIGAICIAPAIVAKIFQKYGGAKLTIGAESDASKAIEAMGSRHIASRVNDIVIDADRHLVTTAAYMYGDASLKDIAEGIRKLTSQVVAFCR